MGNEVIDDVVIVAGVDYPHFDGDSRAASFPLLHAQPNSTRDKPWNWRKCADRMAALAAAKYGKSLRVTIFDFAAGTRETFRGIGKGLRRDGQPLSLGALNWSNYRVNDKAVGRLKPLPKDRKWPKRNKDDTSPPSILYVPGVDKLSPTTEVSFEQYQDEWGKVFRKEGSQLVESSISIIHIYEFIRSIGRSRKGADGGLRELHFFSHAWRGGPILANTADLASTDLVEDTELNVRDPFDKDGRAKKDFIERNFTRDQLDAFRAAFSRDAFSFIWGCDATHLWKELIRQTKKEQDRGATRFRFQYTPCWGDKSEFNEAFGTEEQTIGGIRQKIAEELKDQYSQELANASGAEAVGALPGTSSDPDVEVAAQKVLWHISRKGTDSECLHPSNFKRWLEFYKHELKVVFDRRFDLGVSEFQTEFGRGYAQFKPGA